METCISSGLGLDLDPVLASESRVMRGTYPLGRREAGGLSGHLRTEEGQDVLRRFVEAGAFGARKGPGSRRFDLRRPEKAAKTAWNSEPRPVFGPGRWLANAVQPLPSPTTA